MKNKKVDYATFAKLSIKAIFEKFNGNFDGMTKENVELARENFGENIISQGKKTPFIIEILKAYKE